VIISSSKQSGPVVREIWEYLCAHHNQRDEMGNIVNWNDNYQNNPFFTLYNNTKPQTRNRVNGFYAVNDQLLPWL
jgi:hypothetical protein